MKSSLVLIGLIGGGAYFLSKKSTPKKIDTKNTKPESTKPDNSKLPNINDQNDNSDIPNVNDDNEPSEEDNKTDGDDLMKEYYDPYLITNNTFPTNVNSKRIWISNDCMNWGIRKEYDFSLPEKYLYPNPTNPDKLTTPSQYWDKVGDNVTPSPWYLNNLLMDIPPAAIAANVVDYFSPCDISPPRRNQFKTYGEYKIVRDKFAETPLGKLFEYIYKTLKDVMFDSWAKNYPEEAKIEIYKGWVLDAIKNNPKITDPGKITDIAYISVFGNIPDAPKKLDLKNPDHKPYIDAWIRMNIEAKNYKGLIKQYGLD